MYMIWQMMMATLHSNGQLRTEKDGNIEKGCQKPAVQQNTVAAADGDDECISVSLWDIYVVGVTCSKFPF